MPNSKPPSLPKIKLPIRCPIWNPLPPQNETANRVPNSNPHSLPKMKLSIGCPIQNPLKHEYYRFLIPVFLRLEGNVPPPPSPRNEKVGFQVNVTFGSVWCTPLPPRNEKVGFQVKVTLVVLDDVPPHSIILFYAWTGNWWISISIGYEYMDSNPICHPFPAQKLKCSFLDYIQLLMIGQASQWTRTPSATPLQPKKWNVHFWIHSTSDDQLSDPSKKRWPKCKSLKNQMFILDYIQLLMIGSAIQVKNINWNAKK